MLLKCGMILVMVSSEICILSHQFFSQFCSLYIYTNNYALNQIIQKNQSSVWPHGLNWFNLHERQQNVELIDEVECQVCIEGKMYQFRYRSSDERATSPTNFLHCDFAGPLDPVARYCFKYILCRLLSIQDRYDLFPKCKNDTPEPSQQFMADNAPFRPSNVSG